MNKIIMSLLLAMLALPFFAQAQVPQDSVAEVKGFEFEVKCGATFPLEKVFGNNGFGSGMGIEARWNMQEVPLDFGLEMNLAVACSKKEDNRNTRRLFSIATITDYNFMRGKRFSPFVGMGLGMGNCNVVYGSHNYDNEGNCCMLLMRAGVEMFHHLRLTLDTRIAKKGYSQIGLSLGFVFGGGVKKKK